jgi:hypothetical protein
MRAIAKGIGILSRSLVVRHALGDQPPSLGSRRGLGALPGLRSRLLPHLGHLARAPRSVAGRRCKRVWSPGANHGSIGDSAAVSRPDAYSGPAGGPGVRRVPRHDGGRADDLEETSSRTRGCPDPCGASAAGDLTHAAGLYLVPGAIAPALSTDLDRRAPLSSRVAG